MKVVSDDSRGLRKVGFLRSADLRIRTENLDRTATAFHSHQPGRTRRLRNSVGVLRHPKTRHHGKVTTDRDRQLRLDRIRSNRLIDVHDTIPTGVAERGTSLRFVTQEEGGEFVKRIAGRIHASRSEVVERRHCRSKKTGIRR